MSSTWAVREVQKSFQALGNNAYYYKECTVNARSPAKEPTTRKCLPPACAAGMWRVRCAASAVGTM